MMGGVDVHRLVKNSISILVETQKSCHVRYFLWAVES